MKEKLEQFKELHGFFSERAEKLAELKNKGASFSYSNMSYEDGEWEIEFTKSSGCGCCSDDSWTIYVKDEEILLDFDDMVAKLEKEQEDKRIKEAKQKATNKKREETLKKKKEIETLKKLKEKYGDLPL